MKAHKPTNIPLSERLALLEKLRLHFVNEDNWLAAKNLAHAQNAWFVPQFIQMAVDNITRHLLDAAALKQWVKQYQLPELNLQPKTVGIVMAGNIPLVGFHDFLCGFLTGHRLMLKASSKDEVLIKHVVSKLSEWNEIVADTVVFSEQLKGCDAYIATGSSNTGRYFEYYFRNYPSIIRKNRTSVAIIDGTETIEELDLLANDMLQYFGFGCRNVSKMYVPENYDFVPLLSALDKFKWMENMSKFKNNYDYNLSLHILNNQYYMTNGTLLLVEKAQVFAAISQVNFEFYKPGSLPETITFPNHEIQCIIGHNYIPFGMAQSPSLTDYADGIDTMAFLAGV